jgi:glycosyltransferase involved in cell wall biosynthesis
MNVLHVCSSIDPRSGGPVEALRGLTTAQVEAGLAVKVVATWRREDELKLADALRERGVLLSLIGPCWGPLGWHRHMKSIVKEAMKQVSVVHIHGLWEEIQHRAARLALQLGKPYLIRPCGMLDPWSLGQGRWKKALYLRFRLRRDLNQAAALHFTTQTECDLTRPLGLRSTPLIEPNGISLDEFADLPRRGSFRSRHGIASDRSILLFLSRLHHKKGLDLLLPAVAQLPDREVLIVLAGPDHDGYRGFLEAEIARLGLTGRVLFTGMLQGKEKQAALVDADLFVLPSYQENFGIAVVEALAAGTPVIISDQVNIEGEIRAAGVGGVVPTRSDALAGEIARWLADEGLRRSAAAAAPRFVRERFGWDRIALRWVKHYGRMVCGREEAAPL